MNAFLMVVEVAVKILIGLITGGGVGTLVFGIALINEGVVDFNSPGPPPGPIFIGVGSGLLTAALAMMLLFVGPLSRRWFSGEKSLDEPTEKWHS